MKYNSDIEGEVTYIPTEAGGRKLPILQEYRTQFYYSGRDWDAVQQFPDVAQVNPGETARVIFSFVSPDVHVGKISPGMMFLIREGSRTVGYGKVTKILDLEKSAKVARERRKT